MGYSCPKPGLFERNQGHQQFHDERAAAMLAPIAGVLLPPDPDPGQIGLAGLEMVMPPPGFGGLAPPRHLAIGIGAILLPRGRTGIRLVLLPAMDAPPGLEPLLLRHVRALIGAECRGGAKKTKYESNSGRGG